MDRNPSTTLDTDTLSVKYATPRDAVEQGVHLSPEEDTAKPVVLLAIFPKDTIFIAKVRTSLLETDDDNAINLNLNANTIFPDRVYHKKDARRIKVKEELESVK